MRQRWNWYLWKSFSTLISITHINMKKKKEWNHNQKNKFIIKVKHSVSAKLLEELKLKWQLTGTLCLYLFQFQFMFIKILDFWNITAGIKHATAHCSPATFRFINFLSRLLIVLSQYKLKSRMEVYPYRISSLFIFRYVIPKTLFSYSTNNESTVCIKHLKDWIILLNCINSEINSPW